MKILYVEDNQTDADLTKRALKKAFSNCIIYTVSTIVDAKKTLQNEKDFDLVLLDLNLPDGSGLDILSYIRESKMPLAVIILTGISDEEIAITALKSGADDYFPKDGDYLKKLPKGITQAINTFKKDQLYKSTTLQILYAEWHESDIEFTERHFNKYAPNLHITAVPSVNEALKLLPLSEEEKGKFDVLLMDYRLPGINALEAIKIIRQDRKLSIPIVIVTGYGNEEIAVQALKLGADDYLVKREKYLLRLPSIILNVYQKCQLEIQQQELQKSQNEYKSFFDDDLTGDFISTINGKILNCNQAYLNICGFSSKEEALNFDVRKLYVRIEQRNEIIEKLKNGEKVISYETDLKRLDGKVVHVIGNMVGGFDKEGNLQTLKGYIFDDTERKIAVNELRKLNRAIEQSPATVLITDLQGKIEYVNKKFTEVTGYSPEEIIGKTPRIFNSKNQPKEVYEDLWNTITSGKDWFGEFLNKKKDGSLFWEQASISSIKDKNGKITHYLGVKEDITEKKKEHLKLVNALEKAKESDQLKTAFLNNISHEIRTPMNAIVGFSGFLKDPNLSFDNRKKYSDIIIKSSTQLLSIITDIISIATIEAGQEKIIEKHLNLNSVLNLIHEQFKEKAAEKNLDFTLTLALKNGEDLIILDETKLIEIITNLVGNALKFTNEGFVNFGYKVVKDQLEFYVEDSGIGIPANLQSDIFNRFNQVERTVTRFYGGSGLGLSISKSYVELLGGKISLHSELDKGTTFYVTLPFKKALKEDAFLEESPESSQFNINIPLTILVAEDEDLNFMLIKELLSNKNIQLLRAINGLEAAELCKSNPQIDLVLMDIKMPVMNGYEATKEIRKFAPKLPILAQTAYSVLADKQKALDVGCNDMISKPFQKNEFVNKINTLLKGN